MGARGEALHVDDHGRGPPVVLLHGMPSSPDDFAALASRLARRHRVLVPHLPGYGRTPSEPGPYSLDGVIERLGAALAERRVFETAWLAFSGGAYKAVALALTRSPVATRMILLSPVVGLDPDAAEAFRQIAAATRAGTFDPRPTWLDRMTRPGWAGAHAEGAARVLAWLDAVPLETLCDELVAAAGAPDLRPRLGELACPVLVCAGTEDRAVAPTASMAVATSCARGRMAHLDGCGHAALLEDFDAVAHLVESFLAEERA